MNISIKPSYIVASEDIQKFNQIDFSDIKAKDKNEIIRLYQHYFFHRLKLTENLITSRAPTGKKLSSIERKYICLRHLIQQNIIPPIGAIEAVRLFHQTLSGPAEVREILSAIYEVA